MLDMTDPNSIQNESDLVRVSEKLSELYQDYPLTSLTAYSMYWLHQWKLKRRIEAIAILSWRLFPDKFAMVGYRQYPDAFRTNRSLLQMQPKYRNLLSGSAVTGFSLNQRGNDIGTDLTAVLGVPTTSQGDVLGSVSTSNSSTNSTSMKKAARTIEPEREIARVRTSKAFEKWKDQIMTGRDLIHIHGLLGIFDHTPANVRISAMKDLEKYATQTKDEEIQRFLTDVRKTFPHLLNR